MERLDEESSLLMRDEIAPINSGMSESAKERSQHKPSQQREVLVALFRLE
jgi:hypothetical protein